MAIPENLMARLHQANEDFHRARLRLDGIGEMDQSQKREVAAALRAAERELEDVTREIDSFLTTDDKREPDAGPAAPPPGA